MCVVSVNALGSRQHLHHAYCLLDVSMCSCRCLLVAIEDSPAVALY